MGNVSFFKSMWPETKGNAAMFVGEHHLITLAEYKIQLAQTSGLSADV